jgi:hypothetical protein
MDNTGIKKVYSPDIEISDMPGALDPYTLEILHYY